MFKTQKTIFLVIFLFVVGISFAQDGNSSGRVLSSDKQKVEWMTKSQAQAEENKTSEDFLKELQEILKALFKSYEEENVAEFLQHLHPNFASLDFSGNRLNYSQMIRSLRDDFSIMDGIRHEVFVKNITLQKDGKKASVELRWNRRAWFVRTQEEWIIKEQTSRLFFERNSPLKLYSTEGAALFGLANYQGVIQVAQGTLNGTPVDPPVYRGIVGAGGGGGGAVVTMTSPDFRYGQKVNFSTKAVSNYDSYNDIPQGHLGFVDSSEAGEGSLSASNGRDTVWQTITPSDIGKTFTKLSDPYAGTSATLARPIRILDFKPDSSPASIKIEIQ